ncbi:MAG: hypothetical protein ACE5KV_02995, partial [Thermoplasmata archaeon]
IKGGEVFTYIERVETKELFLKAFENLDKLVSILKELDERLVAGELSDISELVEKAEDSLGEACRSGSTFIIDTPDYYQAALGMIFLGMAEDLKMVLDAMLMTKDVGIEVEGYRTACGIVFDAYKAFRENEKEKASEVAKRFRRFMRKKHSKPNIEIARSGFHIARMVTKPFPV